MGRKGVCPLFLCFPFSYVSAGTSVAFGVGKEGVILLPCKVTAEPPYTAYEWAKIEKLASKKGKVYKSADKAKKHIEAL